MFSLSVCFLIKSNHTNNNFVVNRYESPSQEVVSRLEDLLSVDRSLYEFGSSRLDKQLTELRQMEVDVDKHLKGLKEVCSFVHAKCTPLLPPSSSLTSHERTEEKAVRRELGASNNRVGDRIQHTQGRVNRTSAIAPRRLRPRSDRQIIIRGTNSPSSSSLFRHGRRQLQQQEEEQQSLTSSEQALCWRHAADQRSYAQHLRALAGVPCSRKLYHSPDFNALPEEIKEVATNCSQESSSNKIKKASFRSQNVLSVTST